MTVVTGYIRVMTTVCVIAKIPCKPGHRDEVIAGLQPMLEHVKSESGTLRYILLEDAGDSDTLWMYETYDSRASLDSHAGSDAMKALGAAIGAHLAGAPDLVMARPLGGKDS